MSLDGTFLHCVVSEMLSAGLVGGRIDKIYQPSREEIIISIRSAGKHNKILISSNSMSARVCMTERAAENPSAPPMFCMLLRKHLSGGKLLDITQDGLERIINFDFECMNEIGDMVVNRLTAEIMGRHSNIILMAKKDGHTNPDYLPKGLPDYHNHPGRFRNCCRRTYSSGRERRQVRRNRYNCPTAVSAAALAVSD